jgi:hypothetical protein
VLSAPPIPDSPPPYSEIDPAKSDAKSVPARPTTLELGSSQDNLRDLTVEEAASRDEEDENNAVLGELTI